MWTKIVTKLRKVQILSLQATAIPPPASEAGLCGTPPKLSDGGAGCVIIYYMQARFDAIIGHEAQKEYLRRVLEKETIAHAYCFSGPAHLGKMTLARTFAALALSSDEKMLDRHPDVRILSQSTVTVDLVRQIRQWMHLTSLSGGRKVVIIEEAGGMTVAAQNAFLKTLEEPSGEALMILVATHSGHLLDTVISRTIHLRFSRVPRETLYAYLVEQGQKTDDADELASIAAGRPGVAIRLLDEDVRVQYHQRQKRALAFFKAPLAERLRTVQELVKEAKTSNTISQTIDSWYQVAHDALLSSDAHHASDWARALKALNEANEAMQKNGNVSLSLEHFALAL
ncbi:hypothetical protein IH979_00370 [Patescibacteria group bacterium]|nr:hypothetical protein [Patescibacteria group bacterium]